MENEIEPEDILDKHLVEPSDKDEPEVEEFGCISYLDFGRRVVLDIDDTERDVKANIEFWKGGSGKMWDVIYLMVEEDYSFWSARRSEYSVSTDSKDRIIDRLEFLINNENEFPDYIEDDFIELLDETDVSDYSL